MSNTFTVHQFAQGLFKLHDTHGVPLSIAFTLVKRKGLKPNIAEFAKDAILAGWLYTKVIAVIKEACQDNEIPFDSKDFNSKFQKVYGLSILEQA